MIARPARVRMRNRKPWVRARRRLFGWKVRLPFATATTPSCQSRSQPPSPTTCVHGACNVLRRSSPRYFITRHRRGTYGILGFIPDDVRVAAVPPTFGRLFEGTDLLGAGQTDHRRHTRIPSAQQSVTFGESCHRCVRIGWRAATKTVSFCECRFHRAHASKPPTLADADRGRTPTSRSPGTGDPTRSPGIRTLTTMGWSALLSTGVDNRVETHDRSLKRG